jgi:phage-related baseplate assembly protein
MASPDFSRYIDLTIFDKQPFEIYADAVEYARSALPEWSPIVGSIEDAMLQASSLMTAELGAAINRLPNGIVEALLQLFGVTRNSGTPPTGVIQVTAIDDAGYTIPAGTRFGYLDTSDSNNSVLYTFDTINDVEIPQGSITVSVNIRGSVAIEYPTLLSGTNLQLLNLLSFVDSAVLSEDLGIGADPETDAEYLGRGVAKLASYSAALVLPQQFEQYILTAYPNVFRCKAFSRVNPSNDDWDDAPENGYLTIYGCSVGGASLPVSAASAIVEDVSNRSVAGLQISVEPPTIVPVQVSATVIASTGFAQQTIINNVNAALNTYLHPDYWSWSEFIYYNELISLIDRVSGVDRVDVLTITIPSGAFLVGSGPNYRFNKKGSLPLVASTITVQVS